MTDSDKHLESQPPSADEQTAPSQPPSTESRPPPPPAARVLQDATVISQSPPAASPEATFPSPVQMSDVGRVLVGQTLRHFRLEEFVGGGGMGAVFRATDEQLERTVAVKVLTHRYGQDLDTVRRFRVEAQSAARLNHENIASVYFVDEDKGWNFIVFEFIDGENIRDIVQQFGPLPVDQATNVVAQVTAALDHAAQRDVVHRDIKPSNVLLTTEGKVKLVDMGLARLRQMETDDDLTVSGVTLGTFDYISPEQGRDPRDADVRSDLYSLGCTYYFMLTGQPPYPQGTVLQKLLSHTSDPPPDPRLLRPGLPDDITNIVLRLLAKLPADRYQHPAALMADLIQAAERNDFQLAVSATTSLPPRKLAMSSGLRSSIPYLVPAALLVVAVVGIDWMLPVPANSVPEFVLPKEQSEKEFSPINDEVLFSDDPIQETGTMTEPDDLLDAAVTPPTSE